MNCVQLLQLVFLRKRQYLFVELLDGLVVLRYFDCVIGLQNCHFLGVFQLLVRPLREGGVEMLGTPRSIFDPIGAMVSHRRWVVAGHIELRRFLVIFLPAKEFLGLVLLADAVFVGFSLEGTTVLEFVV